MKAILVIDIDEKYIGAVGTEIQFFNRKYSCKWKLKPIPEPKEPSVDSAKEYWFACGFNDCLEEIMGEGETE